MCTGGAGPRGAMEHNGEGHPRYAGSDGGPSGPASSNAGGGHGRDGGGAGSRGGGHAGALQEALDNQNTVMVANLTWWTTDAEMEAIGSEFGALVSVRFLEDRATGGWGWRLVDGGGRGPLE